MCHRDNWKATCSAFIVSVRMSILCFLALLRSLIAFLYCAVTRRMCVMDIVINELDFKNTIMNSITVATLILLLHLPVVAMTYESKREAICVIDRQRTDT